MLRVILIAALCRAANGALSMRTTRTTRRDALLKAAGVAAAATAPIAPAAAADPPIKLYFGAGCFWHVQHEFVKEEQAFGRTSQQITAVSGYAGGQRLGDGGKVCYHNMQRLADYGQLGHAEAVEVSVPASAVPRFAKKYFDLFGSRGIRHDPQDRGGEYRSVLGLPGGQSSPYFEAIQQAAAASPMKLYAGRGDEPDTIGAQAVLVYDSNKFPFCARAPLLEPCSVPPTTLACRHTRTRTRAHTHDTCTPSSAGSPDGDGLAAAQTRPSCTTSSTTTSWARRTAARTMRSTRRSTRRACSRPPAAPR